MNLYLTNTFGGLISGQTQQFRFKSEYISIHVNRKNDSLKISLSPIGSIKKLQELENLINFSRFISSLKDNKLIKLKYYSKDEFSDLLILSTSEFSQSFLNIADSFTPIRHLKKVFQCLDFPFDKDIDLQYLEHKKEKVRQINLLLGEKKNLDFKFITDDASKLFFDNSIALIPFMVYLGEFTFWCIISVIGISEVTENENIIRLINPKVSLESKSNVKNRIEESILKEDLIKSFKPNMKITLI